ncbi:MAG TPA: LysR family transcriptional regulator substrate-binding protein, partial [Chthoniobacteraceae bacterium]|nr:LysR family transcriptional regulator substrate-binding protein [Chthoniobacteraceae bacterium]
HRRKFPGMTLQLRDVNQSDAQRLLLKQEVDVAITEAEGATPSGIKSSVLITLPLVLLVPADHPATTARQLWKRADPAETLISLPADEVISKLFQQGLDRLRVKWTTGIEVSSLDLLAAYVGAGFGIGVSVLAPGAKPPPKVKALPLPSFEPLVIAALWKEPLPPLAKSFLDEALRHAQELRRG